RGGTRPAPPPSGRLTIARRVERVTQFGFQSQAAVTSKQPANDHDADVRGAESVARRPCLVTLESGIQALVEIASFTYVEGIPLAIGAGLAENVDPADWLERGPDGVRFKGVNAARISGPVDVDSHRSN